MAARIRWGRILLGGLAIEVVMFAIIIPLRLYVGEQAVYYSVPVLVVATAFIAAMWVCRPIQSRFVLHGALVAAVASLIYTALTMTPGAPPTPWLYIFSNALRIVAGAAGGRFAEARARPLGVR